jgi:hypothetical protein
LQPVYKSATMKLSMKILNFTKILRKPVHPMAGIVVLGAGILLAVGVFIMVLQQQSISPSIPTRTSTPLSIPTLAPGQQATYTFYIHAPLFYFGGGNGNDANGKPILKAHQQQGYNVISLDASEDGRTAELPIGTVLFLYFPTGGHITSINPRGVVEGIKGKTSVPFGDIGILQVVGSGTATITVSVQH